MKPLPTIERLRDLLAYDPQTGALTWLVDRGGSARAGRAAGTSTDRGYWHVTVDKKILSYHRVCWAMHHGCWPNGDIDHINGVRGDNRAGNLRDVTKCVNMQNQRSAHRNNKTTGLLGAFFSKWSGRYTAQITLFGHKKHLGYFPSADLAHQAYLAAKNDLQRAATAKRRHHVDDAITAHPLEQGMTVTQ